MAYWNFFELATFGDIIGFYKFYFFEINKGRDKTAKQIKQLLFPVRTLRNAAAHNSCLLNTLRDKLSKPHGTIAKTLIDKYGMNQELVQLTRRVPLVHDFSALMLCYDAVVNSKRSREVCSERLRTLSSRLSKNIELFSVQIEVYNCLRMLVSLAQTFADKLEQPAQSH